MLPSSEPSDWKPTEIRDVQYYDVAKNWHTLSKFLDDPEFIHVIGADLNKYSIWYSGVPFKHGQLPSSIEPEWDLRASLAPDYWRYAFPGACHWVVNGYLRLISLAEPERPWRIISSQRDSTVWDGDKTIFDITYYVFEQPAQDAFRFSFLHELMPDEYLCCYD